MAAKYPKTKGLALSASFAVLLGLFSLVSIPLPLDLVPITLQVLGVFLILSLLGPRYGSLSCLIYLMFGAVGLPVFHGGTSGVSIMLGPTGGYLVSFPIAALAGGFISRKVDSTRKSDLLRVVASFAVALVIIYSLGDVWLMEYLHLSPLQAILSGIVPFIGFDVVKAIVVTPISVRLRASRFDLPVRSVTNASSSVKLSSEKELA
ncbi:MAG: biotin transporter BioY [Nitrososphaerota archaeon]|nr:biotin transporter BioY [Nitrososphaerota archaeon]MDG6924097.1 biotin transporter BioY [Nitrososphaerota archaeon]